MKKRLICGIAGRLLAEGLTPETLTLELAKNNTKLCVGHKVILEFLDCQGNIDLIKNKMQEYLIN